MAERIRYMSEESYHPQELLAINTDEVQTEPVEAVRRLEEETAEFQEFTKAVADRNADTVTAEMKPVENQEINWSREQVTSLPRIVGESATKLLVEKNPEYVVNERVLLYHDYHKEEGSNAHIANVKLVTIGYLHGVRTNMIDGSRDYPPSRELDPLEIHKNADKLISSQPDHLDFVKLWNSDQLTDERKMQLVEIASITSAALHDIGNSASDVDWKSIKNYGFDEEAITLPKTDDGRMKFHGAEPVTERIFISYIDTFSDEMELNPEEAEIVEIIGRRNIQDTVFNYEKIEGFDLIDQTAQIFNPNTQLSVIGLVNETRLNNEPGHMKAFTVDSFFGGFVKNRFETSANGGGTGMSGFIEHFDKLKKADPDAFCLAVGIKSEDRDKVLGIEDLEGFVNARLALQAEIAKTYKGWNTDEPIEFADAFKDWSKDDYDYMFATADLYHDEFWNPELSIEDFTKINQVAA